MLILTKEQVEVIERVEDEIDYVNTRISNIRIGMRVCNYEFFTDGTREKEGIENMISKLECIEKDLEKLICFELSDAGGQEFILHCKNEKIEDEQQKLQYIVRELQDAICRIVFTMGQLTESVTIGSAMLLNLSATAMDLNNEIQSLIEVLYEIEIK